MTTSGPTSSPAVTAPGNPRFSLGGWLTLATGEARGQVLVCRLFLRILGLIYLVAFISPDGQISGLVGEHGILPATEFLAEARRSLGGQAIWRIPTVFWIGASDAALHWACLVGSLAAGAVILSVSVRPALLVCYGLYLSLTDIGQDFLSFQWDMLLLEAGFLALLLPDRTRLVVWLYRFLLFRFMLMGGVVKLASGDPSWRDLSALRYRLETQPLPSPLAWYVHQLPDSALQIVTVLVLVIELVIPFFVFFPRPYRLAAAASLVALQGGIMLTGSFAFFNVLTVALCVFLLEDRDIQRGLPAAMTDRILSVAKSPGRIALLGAFAMTFVVLITCASLLWTTNLRRRPPQPFDALLTLTSTLNIVNGYGPFAVVNMERREIVIEGSNDGAVWRPYEFRYKPGNVRKPLSWNLPYQPRLDWQMWFAALGDPGRNAWFPRFVARLHEGAPDVVALLRDDPFGGQSPAYLRTLRYRYRFTTSAQRSANGQIWQRQLLGRYDYAPSQFPRTR